MPSGHHRVLRHLAGLGAFVVGSTVLELGNFSYNIVLLAGKDSGKTVPTKVKHYAECLYATCMPLSNLIGGAMFVCSRGSRVCRGHARVTGAGHGGGSFIVEEYVHLSRSVPYFVSTSGSAAGQVKRRSRRVAAKLKKKGAAALTRSSRHLVAVFYHGSRFVYVYGSLNERRRIRSFIVNALVCRPYQKHATLLKVILTESRASRVGRFSRFCLARVPGHSTWLRLCST